MTAPAVSSSPALPSRPIAELAGLRRRAGALVYELVLAVAVVMVAGAVASPIAGLLDPALTRPLFRLVALAALAAYFVYCWCHGGQTLPMKTWRLRLVTAAGDALTARDAWRRFLLAVPCVAAGGVGYVWALFDREGQFLHDRLAGTRIIRIQDSGNGIQ
ncbi:MAG: RDD family protein [Burkholderiales bacterium]